MADDTSKILAEDGAGRPAAVLLVSSPRSPELVARAQRHAREARQALGPGLGTAVLAALAEGEHDGLTWAILPYCTPFPERGLAWRWQRRALGRAVLDWLEAVAGKTRAEPLDAEVAEGFEAPLERAVSFPDMPGSVREAAKSALDALARGSWRPSWVLAHNDLWKGNLLRAAGGPYPFVVIDWPASALRGHAFFDLVRCGRSLGLGRTQLALAVRRQATLLGCEPADARFHLAAGIGHIGRILDHMPPELYRSMAASAFESFERLGF